MTLKAKHKLRMAPTATALSEQQEAAARLLKLESWTEQPNNPPATGPAAILATVAAQLPAPVPLKQWEGLNADAPHPYHLIMTERLFQKIDYVWKRKGYKSMKEWMLQTMEAEAGEQLKNMGEI